MSLLNDQQRKKAQVKTPTIKPVKAVAQPEPSPLPELQPDILGSNEEITGASTPQVEAPLPVYEPAPVPEQPLADVPQIPDFSPIAPVELQKKPDPTILETPTIWSNVNQSFGEGSQFKAEVTNTTLPSFSVKIPDSSALVNSAFGGVGQSYRQFNESQAAKDYAAAQQALKLNQTRGALPNTPQADKKWYDAPVGYLGDLLFGNERARKLSEEGRPDLGAGSFGRAGAGIGGAVNYTLGILPSLFVGAVGEVNKAVSGSLQGLGVKKETADGFARDGFLTFLPDVAGIGSGYSGVGNGKLNPNQGTINLRAIKPSSILNFNFDAANKRNLLLDAIAGDPLADVNDPTGAVKYGRIYTREQRKEGNNAVNDPVGFSLQILTALANPGEIPGDYLISAGVSKLFSAFKKPAKAAAQQLPKVAGLLPPSTTASAEAALAARANAARTAAAGRQLNTPPPSASNFGFDLSSITEEQARRLNNPTPRLNGFVEPNQPFLPSSGQIEVSRRGVASVAEDLGSELNPPRLDGGEARLQGGALEFINEAAELNPPRLDGGEAYIEYPTNAKLPAAANPSLVPRVYNGSTEVSTNLLPPAFAPDEVPEVITQRSLPYSSPAKVALEVGIGNPGFRLDKPGALALRPLAEVVATLKQVEPKLLEGYDGISWSEFKSHLSNQGRSLEEFSAIGEDLSELPALLPPAKNTDALVEQLERKAVITSERIKKVRNIRAVVERNSSIALDKIDAAGEARSVVENNIGKYQALLEDTITNVIEPRQAQVKELMSIIREGKTIGASEAWLSAKLDVVESMQDSIEEVYKQVDAMSDAIKNLRGNDLYIAEARYNQAMQELKKTRFNNELLTGRFKVTDDFAQRPKLYTETIDDLLTSADELALHKLALDKPLAQLDSLFEETVDYGRKQVDSSFARTYAPDDILEAIENGSRLNFRKEALAGVDNAVVEALMDGDADALIGAIRESGYTIEDMVQRLATKNNSYIDASSTVANVLPPAKLTTVSPPTLFHGSALDQWTPPQQLYANGSRGELGQGTYFIADEELAKDYALARVNENVSPASFDYDLYPSVYEAIPQFTATLDARKPADKATLKQIFSGLPDELQADVTKSLNRRRKDISYIEAREMVEVAMVKAGVEPTEDLLAQVDATVSKNLRMLGFDSVYDDSSKFLLSLDNSRLTVTKQKTLPAPTALESVVAKYNADSYAAKVYDKFLTTDANLRDSAYKLNEQQLAAVDDKLAEVQDEIIRRDALETRSSVLPDISPKDSRPTSFADLADELTDGGVCDL